MNTTTATEEIPLEDGSDNSTHTAGGEKQAFFNATGEPVSTQAEVDSDHTIILNMTTGTAETQLDDFTVHALGINPVFEKGSKIIAAIMQLRDNPENIDIDVTHETLHAEMLVFEKGMEFLDYNQSKILAMRYCLCAVIDEFTLRTLAGGQSNWSSRSLLNTFYNETWGGEKFFLILERLENEPKDNLHLLEVLYICLRLGFEGRYRVKDDGREELASITDNLYHTIRRERGDFERELSPAWRGMQAGQHRLKRRIPIWFLILCIIGILTGLFWFFDEKLEANTQADLMKIESRSEILSNPLIPNNN